MHKDGIIGEFLTEEDFQMLTPLAATWGRIWYVREQLRHFTPSERKKMAETPDLDRVDRYILACYLNMKPGKRLFLEDIQAKVKKYLGAEISEKKIIRMRQLAYNVRRGHRTELKKALAESENSKKTNLQKKQD
jgi:hypothetical protein